MAGFWRAVRTALTRPVERPVQRAPRSWVRCPICDRRLVGPYAAGYIGQVYGGRDVIEPSRAELVAKCPVHGKRPYNDPDVPQARQLAYDDDEFAGDDDDLDG